MKNILIFLGLIILVHGCTAEYTGDKINEGIIEYKINYIENNIENIPVNFLPKTMTLKFKDHMSMNTIEGFLGLFSISNINNSRKGESITLLKVFDNKYLYPGEKDELSCCFDPFKGMQLTFTEDTKEISGFTCYKVIVTLPGDKINKYEIYYTNEIHIDSPNNNNPFNEIDGVLMEFVLQIHQLKMNITANSFKPGKIKNADFEIPSGYQTVPRNYMEAIVEKLID